MWCDKCNTLAKVCDCNNIDWIDWLIHPEKMPQFSDLEKEYLDTIESLDIIERDYKRYKQRYDFYGYIPYPLDERWEYLQKEYSRLQQRKNELIQQLKTFYKGIKCYLT